MTDREIRAYLRAATAAKILSGWYAIGWLGERMYIVAPESAPTRTLSACAATDYCGMLREAGVEPLYRDSEPEVVL